MEWKERSIWILCFFGLFLVWIVSYFFGGKGYAELGFAATVISIILAVVAIFYSIIQGADSQHNMGEMRGLVSDASRLISVKADEMTDSVEAANEMFAALGKSQRESDGTRAQDPTCPSVEVSFDPKPLNDFILATMYAMVKSREHNRAVDFIRLGRLMCALGTDRREADLLAVYCAAIPSVCKAFWGSGAIEGAKVNAMTVRQLPTGLADCIQSEIQARDNKSPMKGHIKAVDSYFQQQTECSQESGDRP